VRPVRRLLPALVLPAVLLAATGCSEAAGPTQEQYAAAADGVCEATDEKLEELGEERDVAAWESASAGEGNTYVERPERWVRAKVVPEYERMSSRLKGMQPPDGDRAYLADLYADLDARIEVLHNRPSDGRAAIDGDARLRERFASYGMDECPGPEPTAGEPPSEEPAVEGAGGQGQ